MSSATQLIQHPEFKDIFQHHFDDNLKIGKTRAEAAADALLQAKYAVEKIINGNNLSDDSISQSIHLSPSKNLMNSPFHQNTGDMDISAISAEYAGISPIFSSGSSELSNDIGIRGYKSHMNEYSTHTTKEDMNESIKLMSSTSMNLQEEYDDYIIDVKSEMSKTNPDVTWNTNDTFGMDDVYNDKSEVSFNNNPAAETTLRMEKIYDEDSYTFGDNPSFIAPTPSASRNNLLQPQPGDDESFVYEENPSFLPTRQASNNNISFVQRNISIVTDSTASPSHSHIAATDLNSDDNEAIDDNDVDDVKVDDMIKEVKLDFKVDKPTDQYMQKLEDIQEQIFDIFSPSKDMHHDKDVSSIFSTSMLEDWFHTDTDDVTISTEDPSGEEWSVIMSAARTRMAIVGDAHNPHVDSSIAPDSNCFCM